MKTGLKSAGLKCGARKTPPDQFPRHRVEAYLPGREVFNHDHEGGSSRARLLHCTWEWLTPAISPNVGNSTSSFLLVGICVRANPFNNRIDSHCMRKIRLPNHLIATSESPGLVLTDGTTPGPGMRTRFGPLQLCTWKGNQVSFDLFYIWHCFCRFLSFFSISKIELRSCIQKAG